MTTKTTEAAPVGAYRVPSPSIDLCVPTHAPSVPPTVAAASDAVRTRIEACAKPAAEWRALTTELGIGVGRPVESLPPSARERLDTARQAVDSAQADAKWACKILASEIFAAKGPWLEALNDAIERGARTRPRPD